MANLQLTMRVGTKSIEVISSLLAGDARSATSSEPWIAFASSNCSTVPGHVRALLLDGAMTSQKNQSVPFADVVVRILDRREPSSESELTRAATIAAGEFPSEHLALERWELPAGCEFVGWER